MSKAQHTPGPWIWKHVNPDSRLQTVSVQEIYADRGEHIYEMIAYTTANIFGSNNRIGAPESNARIIAASWELLEALKLTRKNLSTLIAGRHSDSVLMSPWLAVVDAAIAEAEGE